MSSFQQPHLNIAHRNQTDFGALHSARPPHSARTPQPYHIPSPTYTIFDSTRGEQVHYKRHAAPIFVNQGIVRKSPQSNTRDKQRSLSPLRIKIPDKAEADVDVRERSQSYNTNKLPTPPPSSSPADYPSTPVVGVPCLFPDDMEVTHVDKLYKVLRIERAKTVEMLKANGSPEYVYPRLQKRDSKVLIDVSLLKEKYNNNSPTKDTKKAVKTVVKDESNDDDIESQSCTHCTSLPVLHSCALTNSGLNRVTKCSICILLVTIILYFVYPKDFKVKLLSPIRLHDNIAKLLKITSTDSYLELSSTPDSTSMKLNVQTHLKVEGMNYNWVWGIKDVSMVVDLYYLPLPLNTITEYKKSFTDISPTSSRPRSQTVLPSDQMPQAPILISTSDLYTNEVKVRADMNAYNDAGVTFNSTLILKNDRGAVVRNGIRRDCSCNYNKVMSNDLGSCEEEFVTLLYKGSLHIFNQPDDDEQGEVEDVGFGVWFTNPIQAWYRSTFDYDRGVEGEIKVECKGLFGRDW